MFCRDCGEVEHDPDPTDEAHCPCWGKRSWLEGLDYPLDHYRNCYEGENGEPCPCHGPGWLTENDADVPDFSPSEL